MLFLRRPLSQCCPAPSGGTARYHPSLLGLVQGPQTLKDALRESDAASVDIELLHAKERGSPRHWDHLAGEIKGGFTNKVRWVGNVG